ncbi:Nif3-like dinuclear metal center hexameric protein [Jiulongibacter sediminis]|uniref:Nif3-like dinuclear metal center hexameric protein n=1 Tax=Jiulongibacter sediminis TaxID=1605367 RepID=UPI0026EFF97C|nr:Nif3-like dinuclear metal center hexameric protein [Jiulongibacter sediminis]
MRLADLTNFLESWAPLSYQESYDNAGLITGNPNDEITGVLVSLDCIENVIQEAIEKKCNVIIAHHPIVFKGLKKITGKTYVERTIIQAIKNDIAIYAIHTNLDNIKGGVNFKIAEKLGLQNPRILAEKTDQLMKLTVFVPTPQTGPLLDALYAAGAGDIGNYSNCSFRTEGKGTFKANQQADPTIGKRGTYEEVNENRIEVIFPAHLKNKVLDGMREGHIYEEIAYYLSVLENPLQTVGSGIFGELEQELETMKFLQKVKENLKVSVIKYTDPIKSKIKKVAVCGGAGGFLLPNAIGQKADIFITADYKYHEYFDADGKIIIADIGHYESEQFTKELIRDEILKKFTTFATYLSEAKTNPINYLF